MKIFNVVFFYLISGPVSCYDVFAFIGGQVKIHCFPNTDVYFCKYNVRSQCEQRRIINNRFTLGGSKGSVQMTIRNLSFQDAGMYECGLLSWRSNIQLKVYNDPCCTGTQSVRRSLGQNVMINCSYPVEFKNSFKYLYKLEGESENQLIYTSGTRQNQEGRFSISVDERKNVFHVIINELREDDKGVYSCVLWERDTSVGYYSFFREIHLQVTGEENPDGTLNTRHPVNTIISMCICVSLLLLIGAFVLVYKLKGRKTQGSPSSIGRTEGNDSAAAAAAAAAATNNDYQNSPPHRLSVSIIYQNLTPDTSQSDSVYQPLDPDAIQSFYQRLNPNTTGN